MCSYSASLVVVGGVVLIAIAGWTGGLIPFSRRTAARRGESYDHERARRIPGVLIIAAIVGVLVGLAWHGSC